MLLSKPSDIRNRPYKFLVKYESFVICIYNHASTAISNKSNHFIVAITPVKGVMVKYFGVVVKFKGEGILIWKIEYNDRVVHPIKIKKSLYVPEAQ